MAENNYITHTDKDGSVSISEDVIAAIAGTALAEVEGVGGFTGTFGKKGGVKIAVEEDEVTVEAFILVQYGSVIAEVAKMAQETVSTGIESMTGITVKAVNITVCGIVFEKTK